MGLYKHLRERWKELGDSIFKTRMIMWRKENSITRIERPTRLDRARSLGYKAKKGIFIVRVRVKKSRRMRPQIKSGRRSAHYHRRKIVGKSYQWITEEKANRKYINCEVLNSYYLAKDAKHHWFEVILVDKNEPGIKKDNHLKWISEKQHRGRVYRGLTSAGKRSRGILIRKGKGAEKLRPSLRANLGRAK